MDGVRRSSLPNGLLVITEEMPQVRSVSVGVWVNSGSRHETPSEAGLSHFCEHMVFKGTETRSAEEIACSIDAIGGHLDAFTTKESIAFTAKVLDEKVPAALDILADMMLRPAFRADDIEKEKGVVLEELKMDEDNPDYLIHDLFSSGCWPTHALGRPIIGSKETIESFDGPMLQGFFERTFQPSNMIVTAAGHLRHDELVELVAERFADLAPTVERPVELAPEHHATIALRDKPSLEQVHLCLGVDAHAMADPRRFAGYVLSTLLGGGYSSRLFLKIRERLGLAYSVFSDLSMYSDTGCLSVYAGTSLEALPKVIECVLAEFHDLKKTPIGPEELRRAKDHLKGSLALSLESTSSRMSNLARQEKYFKRTHSLDEVTENIEKVTSEEITALAQEWFHQDKIAIAVLGDLQGFGIDRSSLVC